MSKNWELILSKLGGLPYFGTADVAQLLGKEEVKVKQILLRYLAQNKVIRIKRGYYMTREFYLSNKGDFDFVGMIASVVAPQGYLSTEYVLYNHGVMTEVVMAYTGMTSGKTQRVASSLGSYVFRHIKPELYGGYEEKPAWGVKVKTATLGKALFDYLYIRPHGWAYGDKKYDLVEDLRLNLYDWSDEDKNEFEMWVSRSGSKKMMNARDNIRRYVWT